MILYLIIAVVIIVYLLRRTSGKRVAVVVLGDIGRSPRMQYHALSLASEGFEVDFIGYSGATPHQEVVNNGRIHLRHMAQVPASVNQLPRLCLYAVKVAWQVVFLLVPLLLIPTPTHILMQNPPALPSLFVCSLVSVLRGSRFIIDWHNYGYTILALALGNQHKLVKFAEWYERLFGQFSDSNICVTRAMKDDLANNWNVKAVTMYDRPPAIFKTTPESERHKLFSKLAEKYPPFQSDTASADSTAFSENGRLLPDRPALLVSSTSWTEDEDFSILLAALDTYEAARTAGGELPRLVCVITGRGPQKAHYEAIIAERKWQHVEVCTPWLEAEDYPLLIGSADLGVCLHMSSSGLDLPMKVVDMFGCGLPVCAVNFKCLSELVQHEHNSLVFSSADELAGQVQQLLAGFPRNTEQLDDMRRHLLDFQAVRWSDAWRDAVRPMVTSQ